MCRSAQEVGAPHREYINRKKENAIFNTHFQIATHHTVILLELNNKRSENYNKLMRISLKFNMGIATSGDMY